MSAADVATLALVPVMAASGYWSVRQINRAWLAAADGLKDTRRLRSALHAMIVFEFAVVGALTAQGYWVSSIAVFAAILMLLMTSWVHRLTL